MPPSSNPSKVNVSLHAAFTKAGTILQSKMAVEIKIVGGRSKFDNFKLVIDTAELPIQYTTWSQF
jgi:hypothetical protein